VPAAAPAPPARGRQSASGCPAHGSSAPELGECRPRGFLLSVGAIAKDRSDRALEALACGITRFWSFLPPFRLGSEGGRRVSILQNRPFWAVFEGVFEISRGNSPLEPENFLPIY
jgi:hypothetical protein